MFKAKLMKKKNQKILKNSFNKKGKKQLIN